MSIRMFSSLVIAAAFTAAACAQESSPAPAGQSPSQNDGQSAGQSARQNGNPGSGGGYSQYGGHRGGRGSFGGGQGMGMMGRGLMGTVTAVAADHYTIKTEAGDVYTVRFTADTRMFKRQARSGGPGSSQGPGADQNGQQGGGEPGGEGRRGMGYGGGNPPQQISAADIKTGDMINVMGETDASTKTVNARAVALMDQQTVDQIRAMEANFGKTWLMGKVTAIDGTKITLAGALDNAPHTVVADENTEFRKRRDPITLADIQVGDTVRVDGALKDGAFLAANVNVFGGQGGGTPVVPRSQSPQVPPSAPPQ
ncbi:MAG TPA: DUF5666 domain-containing protein [Terracidiphilus sp.]|nr:DUF5666 domain-containing protein [Terracidiphilus sp.]